MAKHSGKLILFIVPVLLVFMAAGAALLFYAAQKSEASFDAAYAPLGARGMTDRFFDQDSLLVGASDTDFSALPVLSADYSEPVLYQAPAAADWGIFMKCDEDTKQKSAHFSLRTLSLGGEGDKLGLVIYVATERARENGSYDVAIDISQNPPRCIVEVYGPTGERTKGVPIMMHSSEPKKKRPYLPMREGHRLFYSLICRTIEDKVYLLLVQHTQSDMTEYTYASKLINEMLQDYAQHERLQHRAGAYLEMPVHMFCLPLPLTHPLYSALQDQPLSISWQATLGEFEVMPC